MAARFRDKNIRGGRKGEGDARTRGQRRAGAIYRAPSAMVGRSGWSRCQDCQRQATAFLSNPPCVSIVPNAHCQLMVDGRASERCPRYLNTSMFLLLALIGMLPQPNKLV